MLDTHLSHRDFIGGEKVTMADIPLACEMHRWFGLPMEHASYPNLERWWNEMRGMRAARGVLDIPLS
jgi:glutathione S-transferase